MNLHENSSKLFPKLRHMYRRPEQELRKFVNAPSETICRDAVWIQLPHDRVKHTVLACMVMNFEFHGRKEKFRDQLSTGFPQRLYSNG